MSRKVSNTKIRITDEFDSQVKKPSSVLKIKIDDLKTFEPLTQNQKNFFDAYKNQDYFIALHGVAGTGKTFCALYKSLEEVLDKSNAFKKIIIVRSAVQSREMGHLPGDVSEKMEIYKQVQTQPNEKFIKLFWEWVDTKAKHSLDRIGIIGGEPLITPEFYDFLDKLIEVYADKEGPNKTRIWIVTNLNATDNYYNKFLEYIPKLSEKFILEVHISMEALYEQAEYIRNGLNWERFESNVNKLFSSNANIELAFLPSINVMSIPRLPKFLKWVYDLSKKHDKAVMLKQNIVTYPEVHSPFILPNDMADYLDPAIEWMKNIETEMPDVSDKFGTWIGYTEFLCKLRDGIKYNDVDNTTIRRAFVNWFDDFDRKRNLNFVNTFPELANFYNEYKTGE